MELTQEHHQYLRCVREGIDIPSNLWGLEQQLFDAGLIFMEDDGHEELTAKGEIAFLKGKLREAARSAELLRDNSGTSPVFSFHDGMMEAYNDCLRWLGESV